ncbi:MAG: SpoIID/LytB domain-containing protein [bacterium]|nr:SpoIID/LytB domain-containing protein [bacterium]
MAYQAKRNDEPTSKERNRENNTQNIRNAADVAIATKNPYAAAAGGAVKAADKLTDGKSSEKLGDILDKATSRVPGGQALQDALNDLNESGLGDKVGQAARINNSANTQPNAFQQEGSKAPQEKTNQNTMARNPRSANNNDSEGEVEGKVEGNVVLKTVAITGLIFLFGILFLLIIIISVVTPYADFEDALGASYASGEETGSFTEFGAVTEEAKDFYERINDVKLEYARKGKTVEAVKIVAVYHIMASENNNFTYRNMTKAKIREIAASMFKGDEYDAAVFEKNLVNSFFKKQFPKYDDAKRESMAERVIKYIEDYYSFLGVTNYACPELGTCSYQIDGFYYPNSKGNTYLNRSIEFNNLKVRLMQTGTVGEHDYGGTYGKAMEGEDLIPFEEYVMGVTYFEIGDSVPDEAIKAQLIVARNFALARANYMGGWHKLQEESDEQWVLQMANSTADQGFCHPDLGCSAENPQWGQIYSGHKLTAWQKQPLATNSKLRTLATEVMGEVLVNEEGNIIYTTYNSTIQKKFISLANEGYDYKQILLEVYNNENKSNATGISKMSCTTAATSSCNQASSGPYTSWKQYEGPWINIQLGNSGKTIKNIGCAATSVSILIAKSNVPTTVELNPGTFVQTLNANGGFGSGSCLGCINWAAASSVAPSFKYAGSTSVSGYSKEEKLATLKNLINQGYYVAAEVKGNTGEHWVAIDSIQSDTVFMLDPGSTSTNLWKTYPWYNTSKFVYYKVV